MVQRMFTEPTEYDVDKLTDEAQQVLDSLSESLTESQYNHVVERWRNMVDDDHPVTYRVALSYLRAVKARPVYAFQRALLPCVPGCSTGWVFEEDENGILVGSPCQKCSPDVYDRWLRGWADTTESE